MEGWSTDPEEVNESILCCTPKAHSKSPTTSTDTTPGSPASLLWSFSIPDVDPKVKDAVNKLACGMRERRRKRRRLLNNTSPTINYLKRKYNPSIFGITSLSETLKKMEKSTDNEEVLEILDEKENNVTKIDEKDAEDKEESLTIDLTVSEDMEESLTIDLTSILDDDDDVVFLGINT